MSTVQQEAAAILRRLLSDRENELTDKWKASEDPNEREKIHAQVRATIELEDLLEARYGPADASE